MPFVFTDRRHGDLHPAAAGVEARRRAVVDLPWATVRQVHGARVAVATEPGLLGEADAIVTSTPGLAVSIKTADCAPIALLGDGVVGVVHAGWRGIVAGVIPATLGAMRELGAEDVRAVLGPCIHAECYEFDGPELDELAARFGQQVVGTTSWGTRALDVPAAIRAQLPAVEHEGVCTACSPDHWSFRAEGAAARQAVVAWL